MFLEKAWMQTQRQRKSRAGVLEVIFPFITSSFRHINQEWIHFTTHSKKFCKHINWAWIHFPIYNINFFLAQVKYMAFFFNSTDIQIHFYIHCCQFGHKISEHIWYCYKLYSVCLFTQHTFPLSLRFIRCCCIGWHRFLNQRGEKTATFHANLSLEGKQKFMKYTMDNSIRLNWAVVWCQQYVSHNETMSLS